MRNSESERSRFQGWMTPAKFRAELNQVPAYQDSTEYFASPRSQWLRDAWLAMTFAAKLDCPAVRLCKGLRPDFEVRTASGEILSFEATEADMGDRRRGDEYRQWEAEGYPLRHDPVSDWEARRAAIPERVAAVVTKKLSKQYPPQTNLLVYVNLGTYDTWRLEIEEDLRRQTERAYGQFSSVWAIWSGRLYRLWPEFGIASGD